MVEEVTLLQFNMVNCFRCLLSLLLNVLELLMIWRIVICRMG